MSNKKPPPSPTQKRQKKEKQTQTKEKSIPILYNEQEQSREELCKEIASKFLQRDAMKTLTSDPIKGKKRRH